MFPARATHQATHHEWEARKWLLWMVVAAALALLLATRMAGSHEPPARGASPALLPPSVGEIARPLAPDPQLDRATHDNSLDAGMNAGESFVGENLTRELHRALAAQQRGDWQEAIDVWESIRLPIETEVWRHVALAAAHLDGRQTTETAEALEAASELQPENAVVHYFVALWRLNQADTARQWNDAAGPTDIVLIAHVPYEMLPNTRTMYRLAARDEFEKAIAMAAYVDRDQPLIAPEWTGTWSAAPTVGELLFAVGAERFEADSHHALGALLLEYGQAVQAEEHLDAASALGSDVVYGYRDLAREYEQQARPIDAARAYAKQLKQGGQPAVPVRRLVENLHQALTQGW